jgi:hypothetical protein
MGVMVIEGATNMQRHHDSHLDHGLTTYQIDFLLATFADRREFFIETVELPSALGTVPCGLYGPVMGDAAISDIDVYLAKRGAREHDSRLVDRETRLTNKVTVIAGPHAALPCVLFTAFGGPKAPREVGEIEAQIATLPEMMKLSKLRAELVESKVFWGTHALAQRRTGTAERS